MKAKKMSCADMGMEGCPFSVTSADDKEVMEVMNKHAMTSHADKLTGLSDDQKSQMAMTMMTKMQDVEV